MLAERLRGFRQGLKETGFVEGENVAIEYRLGRQSTGSAAGAGGELVRRQVAVIAAAPERRSPPRRQPQRSPSSSWSATTRSGLALSPASLRPVAT